MTAQSSLPRRTPESQGIPSTAIQAFIDDIESKDLELHSLMLVRHGFVVAEGWWKPYSADRKHVLFSLSKSFCSTSAGIAVAEGRFGLDDLVISFFPDDLPATIDENLAAMRVRDLLAMATGHAEDTTGKLGQYGDGNWVKAFLAQPVEYKPGTHFLYNSGATYMVSAIVQKLSGQTVLDYLGPRLFEPLGIQNPTWDTCPRGVNTGGWGLNIRTEDIAKFGELYLRKGVWNGNRLLDESWVEQATSFQVSNGDNPDSDWNQGYGFQFWRCRHNGYRGDGAHAQFCFVMPDQDAVFAVTSGVGDMQAVMNCVWDHLLANMKPAALQDHPQAQKQLTDRLAALELTAPHGADSSPIVEQITGRRFVFAENELQIESLSIDFDDTGAAVTLTDKSGRHDIRVGFQDWAYGETNWAQMDGHLALTPSQACAARVAWTAPDTLTVKLALYETAYNFTLSAMFNGDQLALGMTQNVSFGKTTWPTAHATLAPM